MAGECLYAGYPVSLLTEEYAFFLLRYHSLDDFNEADLWHIDSTGIDHLPLPTKPEEKAQIGTLVWPSGMSRCTYFHCLIHSTQLALIRTALGTGSCGPATLEMTDGPPGNELSFSLYLLSPRPLSQIADEGQMFLCTLVDKRYFLRTKRSSITSVPASWSALFADLAGSLGIALTVDTVDADYGAPTDRWLLNNKPAAVLLDAAANAVGQRIVANVDGTYSTQNYATASAAADAQTAALTKMAGGLIVEGDLIRSVPATVRTVFRSTVSELPYVVVYGLPALSITEYGTATGVSGQSYTVFAELTYTGSNATACANYAAQAATDYYKWCLIDLDVTYPALAEWTPTAAEDRVEWVYEKDMLKCRVVRRPFQVLQKGDATSPYDRIAGGTVAGVTSSHCLAAEVVRTYGSCSAPEGQYIPLVWDGGDSRWEGDGNFDYGSGTGAIFLTTDRPVPTLSIAGVEGLYLQNMEYAFGGATLCSGTGCGSFFVVRIVCGPCPTTSGTFPQYTVGDGYDLTVHQYVVEPTYSINIPQYVTGVSDSVAPTYLQFVVDNRSTTGISQLTVTLTAPDGTQYVVIDTPDDLDANQMAVLLNSGASSSIQTLVSTDEPTLGIYQANVDFGAYTGPNNGLWTLTVSNGGDEVTYISQWSLTFGSPTTALNIEGTATPSSGTAPLTTSLSWTVTGGEALFVYVDWGDGSDIEYFTEDDTPQSHTYSTAGDYEIILRAYDVNGAYEEDSVAVTVGMSGSGTCGDPYVTSLGTSGEVTVNNVIGSVWLRFTPSSTATYNFTLNYVSGVDAGRFVLRDACPSGTILASAAATGVCDDASLTSGTPYYVEVLNSSASDGVFTVTIGSGSC